MHLTLKCNSIVILLISTLVPHHANEKLSEDSSHTANSAPAQTSFSMKCNDTVFCDQDYGSHSPYIPCELLPYDFLDCDDLIDHQGNETALQVAGVGCLRIGGQHVKDVYIGSRECHVLQGIECLGSRNFVKGGFSCVRHNGHYFVTTLLFSLLLGFLGMDRFYLGHTGTAIGKLLTIGGVGIWWIIDIILLVTGNLTPEDGSNWVLFT